MAQTAKISKQVTGGGARIVSQVDVLAEEAKASMNAEAIADGTTDKRYNVNIPLTGLLLFAVDTSVSGSTVTLKAYDSSDVLMETLTVAYGKPIIWQSGETAVFSTDDVAYFLASNSSGVDAAVTMIIGHDITP